MKKILIITPYGRDANSFWRCLGPWSYLSQHSRTEQVRSAGVVDITVASDIDKDGIAWDMLCRFDMVFMHRPCRTDDVIIMRIAKQLGIPVWVDFDDWLFDVPSWNPHCEAYQDATVQSSIAMCLATADIVSVTTSALRDAFLNVNSNTIVIPNAYRSDLFKYRSTPSPERRSTFAWRGTNTHDSDLMGMSDGVKSLKAHITFYGSPPFALTSQLTQSKTKIVKSQDNFMYMKNIYQDAPRVFLVPLVDCFFNRVKSNIAWIEALHAGALVVAPDLPEWRQPGVFLYQPGNQEDFACAANTALVISKDDADTAFIEMKQKYDIEAVNRIRTAILTSVMEGLYARNTRDPFDPLLSVWALSVLKPEKQEETENDSQ